MWTIQPRIVRDTRMRLTRQSEYALVGLAFLADRRSGTSVALAEIARACKLPETFLAKIFQKLARHGLLAADRGPGHGYSLARDATAITVREILEASEGSSLLDTCLFWANHCSESDPCPLHYRLKELHPVLESVLDDLTLAGFTADSPNLVNQSVAGAEEEP